jgi:hypothetical protein
MNWKALTLLLVALSVYAPFAEVSVCTGPSCCAQMQACAGHCNCNPKQTCSVVKPAAVDQQVVAQTVQVSPRIEVELFTLSSDHLGSPELQDQSLSRLPESPPLDTSQKPQARLCLWLI